MSSIVKNVESSPESTCENKKMETSDESSERRQSLRQKKKRKFFMDEEYDSNRNTMNVDNIESKSDNLVTDKEIREMHSKKLAEVFQKYFFAKLDELQIPIEREKTRVTELLKSFNNSISLKEKIFVSKNLGFLVSSSDGTKTYNVNPKELNDNLKYVCNCGDIYNKTERTSCKHCGAVIFNNLDNYIAEYLSKPYQPNINLQLHNVDKMLNKFDFEEPKKDKSSDNHFNSLENNNIKLNQNDYQKDDYFFQLMNIKTLASQGC